MAGAMRTGSGGRVDRARVINFTFDGERFQGLAGDTLASALIANGVHLMGRSFKYHRPRGALSMGSEEPNALVTVNAGKGRLTPNLRATQVEIYEGLRARSQNAWPSLKFDAMALNGAFSAFLPAGFYYKTFIGPKGAWEHVYEPAIRRAAGLGVAPTDPDPDHYAYEHRHCEVAVVGAGPTGLAAARAAARAGGRVVLFDEQAEFGGSALADAHTTIEGKPAAQWVADVVAELTAAANVTLLPRTQAFGYYAQNFLAAEQRVTDHIAYPDPKLPRARLWQVRAQRVIVAAGAHERPLVFPDNDRPGIMLADSARLLAVRYGVRPGNRVVVATSHDGGYRAALDLAAAGCEIAAILDSRPDPDGDLPRAARAKGLPISAGAVILGSRGSLRVTHARVGRLSSDGRAGEADEVACDLIAMTGGWTPSVHLFSQSRGKVRFDAASNSFLPGAPVQDMVSVGACAGVFDLGQGIADGARAGAAGAEAPKVEGADAFSPGTLGLVAPLPEEKLTKAFVDFQNDVTARDIKLATREGMRSIEHIKRYTTTGMATDQGKTSNMNALAIAADSLGREIAQVGLTTFRLPYTPVTFGIFGGPSKREMLDPVRETPIHGWYDGKGAVWEEAGLWKRASRVPLAGETADETVARECLTTRAKAGIMDASTLGKIEVVGPDAAEFLNRLYINSFAKLGVGRCRYGLMLNETGFIYDDGVVMRMADDRFHLTTTTGGAAHVFAVMEDYLQTEWPDLKARFASITEQWATIAVNGPLARKILAPLVEGVDLSNAAFPHMSVREGKICGVPTRLARVSFTGEMGFEVNVPSDYGLAVQEAIWAQAAPLGACAYGLDTLHVLRAEKGFIVVGQDTDGSVTPDDVGMGKMIATSKPDFVGKRSLALADLKRPGRKQLVGLLADDPKRLPDEGEQIVDTSSTPPGTKVSGHVTSSYMSATLGRTFCLAMLADGRARLGQTVYTVGLHGAHPAKVVEPMFYDREGLRLDA
ncbi:MAG: sarcosine oxidase subunit alpha family protein [Pseudomonadota bacterium]|nr:sarcosine oxidase subunit alpha family protein [Pseudomonadota bacterium]